MLDHDLQCDALLWAYVEKQEGYVSLALDEGSFVNHGETEDVINLDSDCYALRDIKVGEELLENYTEFIGFNELKWFDEIRGKAWQEPMINRSNEVLAKTTSQYNKFGAAKMNKLNNKEFIGSGNAYVIFFSFIGMVYLAKKVFSYRLFIEKEKGGI